MMLQVKITLISIVYLLGALFMLAFPPRNFKQSGAKIRVARSASAPQSRHRYLNYSELVTEVNKLANNDPDLVRVIHLQPRTELNRTIIALELKSDKNSIKPGILLFGALDGMAWGAPSAILELALKLLYDGNYQTPFFNDYDWYLVPMSNPDGLQFTHKLRLKLPLNISEWNYNMTVRRNTRPSEWHKNVQKESDNDDFCFGIHVNRNFAYHWQDDLLKMPNPCSQYYPGMKPFLSPEARAIRSYIDKLEDVVQLAIHLHASFVPKKDSILYPWRFSAKQPANFLSLQSVGEFAARNARLPDGRFFEVHQSSIDGRVAGSAIDYIAGVAGVNMVYLLKPYQQPFANFADTHLIETYVEKATSAIFGLVRGWRKNSKDNTLSFFGKDVEF